METEVLMDYIDGAGFNFQLFRADYDGEITYTISSDAVDVSDCGGGCFWCVNFNKLSEALSAMSKIIENDENAGVVDTDWLVKTFGKETC